MNGTLIWDGADLVKNSNAHDLTMCNYNQSPHMCFVNAAQLNGYARGKGVILDPTYTQVQEVGPANGQPLLDQHEFMVIEDGTAVLTTIYKQVPFNSNASLGLGRVKWVTTGIFQDVDIDTNACNFEWSSIDHVPVNMSYVLPSTTDISGDGLTNNTAWDYLYVKPRTMIFLIG
jgi:hypothetical protein